LILLGRKGITLRKKHVAYIYLFTLLVAITSSGQDLYRIFYCTGWFGTAKWILGFGYNTEFVVAVGLLILLDTFKDMMVTYRTMRKT
jgi:hypothetical protein